MLFPSHAHTQSQSAQRMPVTHADVILQQAYALFCALQRSNWYLQDLDI